MKSPPVQCPSDCHICCKSSVTLDLTAVESLMIYLLNRDMVTLTEQYSDLHNDTGYCPFLIKDKCIIHQYKPTACQMFMPFDYHGEPMCYYLAKDRGSLRQEECSDSYMNSNAYDIHGFMMMTQCAIDVLLPCTFFRHIYQGVLWWKSNYNILPTSTRMCLESILYNGYIGSTLTAEFEFENALTAGHDTYIHMQEEHSART
jgi:Fe-S-cluster containining protein